MTRSLIAALVAAALLVACSTSSKPVQPTPPPFQAIATVARATPAGVAGTARPAVTQSTPEASTGTPVSGASFPATGGAPTPGVQAQETPGAGATAAASGAPSTPAAAVPNSAPATSNPPAVAPSGNSAATAAPPSASQAPAVKPTTAPAAAAPAASMPAPSVAVVTPQSAPASVSDVLDQVKIVADDLPAGFSVGSLQAFEPNERATVGYENPDAVLALMNSTGRLGGYIQQVFTPDGGNGAGISIEIWRDAAGAKSFFDQFPKPAGVDYQTIQLPEQIGDQVFAYQYKLGVGGGISVAWRRGRLIMGVGEAIGANQSLDNLLRLIHILDAKAQAVSQ